MLNKRASDNVLTQHSVFLATGVIRNEIECKKFSIFKSMATWQWKIKCNNSKRIFAERKFVIYNSFGKFREIGVKYPSHLQTFLTTTPMCTPKVKQISKPYLSHLSKEVSNIKIKVRKITLLQIIHLSIASSAAFTFGRISRPKMG